VFLLTRPRQAPQSLAESLTSAQITTFTSNGHTLNPCLYLPRA